MWKTKWYLWAKVICQPRYFPHINKVWDTLLAIEAYSEYSHTSKVKVFAEKFDEKSKDVNYFCQKLYLRCLNGFWIYLWTCVGDWRGVKAKKKNSIKRKKQKKFGDTRKVLGIINESDLWWLNFPFSRRFRCSKEICDKISLSWNPFKFLFLLCISGCSRRKQKTSKPGNRGILYLQTQFSVSTS